MPDRTNRRWVLAERPEAEPGPQHFRLERAPVPSPADGQVLIRNLYLSLDPYMRGRMSDRASYARPVEIGEVMIGGTVAEIVESRSPEYQPGQLVVGYGGWQDYAVMAAAAEGPNQLFPVPTDPGAPPISTALGVAGMPGCTAYFGLYKLGKPKAGETLVVSAASGAVGSVVGQLGKMEECRVVGVAGGPDKCAYCKDELGFDDCIDYKAEPDLAAALGRACPEGIDIYFENVGGPLAEAVAPLLNEGSRVPICGFVSQYNSPNPVWPGSVIDKAEHPPESRFFLVWEWPDEYPEVAKKLANWVKTGKLRYRETRVEGLENAPKAFGGLFRGENFGKLIVHIADPGQS